MTDASMGESAHQFRGGGEDETEEERNQYNV